MQRIKNLYTTVVTSWTYNHKHLIVTLSLAVAVVTQSGVVTLPKISLVEAYTYTETYTKAPDPVEVMVEKRALELYESRRAYDLEQYRQEAIRELNEQLLGAVKESPFVDYEALKEEYGY